MLKILALLLLILSVSITANATSFTNTGWNIVLGPIIGITGANFTQQASDVQYLTSTVTFKYAYYEFAEPGKTATLATS